MENNECTLVEQQLQKLLSQNLTINDMEYARNCLKLYGYSNLIKSYRAPYIVRENDSITYRSGVTFEQVCSLYILDKNLRNAVMASMQDLEERIKEAASSVIYDAFSANQKQYLSFKNYVNKKKRKKRFTLGGILDTLNNTLDTDKNPIYHYKIKYGNVPPWILFKSIYFSTIVNFIDLFKTPQKNDMVNSLYDFKELNPNLSIDKQRMLMMDTLYICLDYRNMAAHGGRIYNHNSKYTLHINEIFGPNTHTTIKGFSQLLFLLSLFEYSAPYDRLQQALTTELNRHCSQFPQDVTYLGQILNIDIYPIQHVYISPKSKIYHFDRHCCGLKNATEINLETAEEMGYLPCKKCVN